MVPCTAKWLRNIKPFRISIPSFSSKAKATASLMEGFDVETHLVCVCRSLQNNIMLGCSQEWRLHRDGSQMEALRKCSTLSKSLSQLAVASYNLIFNALPLEGKIFHFSGDFHVNDFSPHNQHTRMSPIMMLHFHRLIWVLKIFLSLGVSWIHQKGALRSNIYTKPCSCS